MVIMVSVSIYIVISEELVNFQMQGFGDIDEVPVIIVPKAMVNLIAIELVML